MKIKLVSDSCFCWVKKGVGVSGGVELYVYGFKMLYEVAVRSGVEVVIVAIDIKNAHNDFPARRPRWNLLQRLFWNLGSSHW